MSMNRAQIDGGANNIRAQQSGEVVLSQFKRSLSTTAGDSTMSATNVLSGIIDRSGPGAAYSDTTPSADSLMTAGQVFSVGDSWSLQVRNTVAFAMTMVAGAGVVLGANTAMVASSTREYLWTILAGGNTSVVQAVVDGTTAVLTGLTATQVANIRPGMGVSGTGIPASSFVTGVNSTLLTVTINANTTVAGTTGITFTPRVQVDGISSGTL